MDENKNNQLVKCLECGKYFDRLGGGHLEKIHKINVKEYLKKYPDAKTSSNRFVEQQRVDKKRQYQNKNLNLHKKAGSRTFDFIKNKDLKKLLQRDYGTAKKLSKSQFWKPCIILYGTIIEAMLIEMTRAKKFEEAEDMALSRKIITRGQYNKIDFIRGLRNCVHLHRELKGEIKISDHLAKTLVEICESIIKYFRYGKHFN